VKVGTEFIRLIIRSSGPIMNTVISLWVP